MFGLPGAYSLQAVHRLLAGVIKEGKGVAGVALENSGAVHLRLVIGRDLDKNAGDVQAVNADEHIFVVRSLEVAV